MYEHKIFLYGLGGANYSYRSLMYSALNAEELKISDIINEASIMRMKNPSIEHVYAIDNRKGLRREFTESVKLSTIESCIIFKDTLEREGILIF